MECLFGVSRHRWGVDGIERYRIPTLDSHVVLEVEILHHQCQHFHYLWVEDRALKKHGVMSASRLQRFHPHILKSDPHVATLRPNTSSDLSSNRLYLFDVADRVPSCNKFELLESGNSSCSTFARSVGVSGVSGVRRDIQAEDGLYEAADSRLGDACVDPPPRTSGVAGRSNISQVEDELYVLG